MKRFTPEQSSDEIYTDCSGPALVGLCINRYSNLSGVISRVSENDNKLIPDTDLFRSYLGLLRTGKSDYEAVTPMREDCYFQEALGIEQVPSVETLRQRFDHDADMLQEAARKCSINLLKNADVPITPLGTGHIPLDIDVFPMDNSGTKKSMSDARTRDATVMRLSPHISVWKAGVLKQSFAPARSTVRKIFSRF